MSYHFVQGVHGLEVESNGHTFVFLYLMLEAFGGPAQNIFAVASDFPQGSPGEEQQLDVYTLAKI